VVWGDRIFVTSAVQGQPAEASGGHDHPDGAHDNMDPDHEYEYVVIALDRFDGAVLWQRTVHAEAPHESTHSSGSWASSSPVTDGRVLVAPFGSRGVFGLNLEGELLWRRDLGDMQVKHGHGEGSSPALADGVVVFNWDHEGESFVVALDAMTGEERWRAPRLEGTSWSSPLIVKHAGKQQVIVAATHRVRSYDLQTGREIWQCGGLSGNVVASPVAADGLVFVANSYETREMMAIRLEGAAGDLTGSDAVVWSRHRDTPYVPSPVLYEGSLCFLKHYQGILTCSQASTGKPLLGPRRLTGISNVYASLAAGGGQIYIVSREGTTAVIDHETFEQIGLNRLDDRFSASPVLVGDSLYLRGESYLYRLSSAPVKPAVDPGR